MRDTQRKKVYDSERKAFSDEQYTGVFSLEESKAKIKQLMNSSYYRNLKGYKRVKVKDGRGCKRAIYYSYDRSIVLPKWARNMYCICHELAHCLAHKTVDASAGHHASFCTHYLALLNSCGMTTEAESLATEFRNHNVMFRE